MVDLEAAFQQEQAMQQLQQQQSQKSAEQQEERRGERIVQHEEGEQGQGEQGGQGEAWWRGNHMTMQHGDLRNSGVLEGKNRLLLDTDIFMCSFVLHENASFLVDTETGLLTGLVASVLESASVGAFLVCTDSGNTLWSTLKQTACQQGWEFWSDDDNAEIGHKIIFGPKTFVILERVCDGNQRESAASVH